MHFKKKLFFNTTLFFFFIIIFTSCKKDDGMGAPPEDDEPIPTAYLGEIDWIKTYGGSNVDEAVAILPTNGGYMVLGTTQSLDGDVTGKTTTDSDFWLLKIDNAGQKIWDKTYGGSEDDVATSISPTNDGGFILSGYSRSSDGDVSGNEGFHDFWVFKIDAVGIILWSKNHGFPGSDQAFHIFQTSDGGYFVNGFMDVSASGGQGNDVRNTQHGVGDYWAIRLDANGNKLWRRYFGGTNNDRSYDALQTDDGGFLLTGASESLDFDITNPNGSYDYWVVRLNANGDLLWQKSFGGSEIDNGYSVTETTDENFIMVGDTRSSDNDVTVALGNADAWVIKFDESGNLIWQKSLGGSEFESARGIQKLSTGNYLLAGNTRSNDGDVQNNNGFNDAWVMVIDESGTLVFEKNIGGSGLDFGAQAIETPDNKILLVGNTESNDIDIPLNKGIKDFLIVKIK